MGTLYQLSYIAMHKKNPIGEIRFFLAIFNLKHNSPVSIFIEHLKLFTECERLCHNLFFVARGGFEPPTYRL